MKNPRSWLEQESARWVREAVVSPEQAARICALYPPPAAGTPWGLIVFSGLGAVVIGLGVVLLLAYNWAVIPKAGKLGLILAGVLGAHGAAWRMRGSGGWKEGLSEVFALLGTMLFGAGIWLVAQVYHIDEHFPNGFLFWGLGALALAWGMRSVPQALVATAALTVWGCVEVFQFSTPLDFAWVLLAGGVGALAWQLRSALLWAGLLAALETLVLSHVSFWGGGSQVFFASLSWSVLLLGLRHLIPAERWGRGGRAVVSLVGFGGFVFCAFVLTFGDATEHLLRRTAAVAAEESWWRHVYLWLLPLGALAVWISELVQRFTRGVRRVPVEEWLCPFAVVYTLGLAILSGDADAALATIVFNLLVLALAAGWMVRGCREGRLAPTVFGSLLLSAWMFARFFDLFDNLALRGLMFLVLGGLLFAEGFFYRKLRRTGATADEGGAA